jgi:hypothetical protein
MPLRRLFGSAQREIWEQLGSEIGAQVEHDFWTGTEVRATVRDWTVTLDSTRDATMRFTRMRAPYANPSGFRFTLHPDGFFNSIAKFFGMQDVEVGHPDFDERFIIKGNDSDRLVALFDDPEIRELVMEQPSIYLTVRDDDGWLGDDYHDETDLLEFLCADIVEDRERLHRLFALFGAVLDRLCRLGEAYEAPDSSSEPTAETDAPDDDGGE